MLHSTGKTKKFYKEVWMDENYPSKCSTSGSYEKVPKDANPNNQTIIKEKITKGQNPSKILHNSLKSKELWLSFGTAKNPINQTGLNISLRPNGETPMMETKGQLFPILIHRIWDTYHRISYDFPGCRCSNLQEVIWSLSPYSSEINQTLLLPIVSCHPSPGLPLAYYEQAKS